jgi:hypothetical protein
MVAECGRRIKPLRTACRGFCYVLSFGYHVKIQGFFMSETKENNEVRLAREASAAG